MCKKVLHLLASNKFSGAENVVCQIINSFKDDKQISMLYCSPIGEIEEALKNRKIKYIPISKLNYFNVHKVIKEYEPDIIHAHDFRASILAAKSCKNSKIISHLHSNPPFIKKWGLKSIFYYLFTHKFKDIVVVSESVLKEAVFLNEKNKEKVTILDNCINKDEILRKANSFEVAEKYDIAFIGRLMLPKAPIKVLEIIKKVNEKRPGTKAVIIGEGEERAKCEKYIKENNLEKVVTLKGFLDNPFPYLKNSKISLMPSIFEGFGLVAIESMIVGIPVLNSGVRRISYYF